MMATATLNFPQPLAEKYRPLSLGGFVGLEKQRKILSKLVENPFPSAWLFVGASGTGKSSMALAIAAQIKGELHHIGSQECKLENLQDTVRMCNYVPLNGGFHVILVDEADMMSAAAQAFLLSRLDATETTPNTIWIFTANASDKLETRFLSRCRVLEFSSYGLNGNLVALLKRVWEQESNGAPEPNWKSLTAGNNVRECLMRLELELMSI